MIDVLAVASPATPAHLAWGTYGSPGMAAAGSTAGAAVIALAREGVIVFTARPPSSASSSGASSTRTAICGDRGEGTVPSACGY